MMMGKEREGERVQRKREEYKERERVQRKRET